MITKKLNLLADKPSVNGRIYSKEDLYRELSKDDILVMGERPFNLTEDVSKVIAVANLNTFSDDEITFDLKCINKRIEAVVESQELIMAGVGELTDSNHVENFKITCLFIHQNNEPTNGVDCVA